MIIVEDTLYNEYQTFTTDEFITHVQKHVYFGPKENMPQTFEACKKIIDEGEVFNIVNDQTVLDNL